MNRPGRLVPCNARWGARTLLLTARLTALLLSSGLLATVDATAQGLDMGTPAVRVQDNLGRSSSLSASETWIQVSYVIQIDGSVSDVLIEDSVGGESSRRSATRALEKWRFQPATWMSLPVKEAHNQVRLFKDVQGVGEGVRKTFRNDIDAVQALVANGRLDDALSRLDEIQWRSNTSLYEFAFVSFMRGYVEARRGRFVEAVFHLRRATSVDEQYLGSEAFPNALRELLSAELLAGMHADAFGTAERIKATRQYRPNTGVESVQRDILELLTSADPYVSTGAIVERQGRPAAFWDQQLLRRSFGFAEIDGSLTTFELRCERRHLVDTPAIDKRWDVLPQWGGCRIYVFGEVGSTFKLLEHPADGG